MQKGISTIIAAVLLTLITIAIISAVFVFTGRLSEQQTQAGSEAASRTAGTASAVFHVESISGQSVFLRNDGSQSITVGDLSVLVDDVNLNYTQTAPIAPGTRGELKVNGLWQFAEGEYTLRLVGSSTTSKRINLKPNAGAVLNLHFDEGSGTKVFDSSGNGKTGTIVSGPTWTQGKYGRALSFDGTNGHVSVPAVLTGNSAFTAAAWANPADITTPWKTIFGETCSGFDLAISVATVQFGRNCGQGNGFYSGGTVEANKWVHLVMTFDGSTLNLYKNGVKVNGGASVFSHTTLFIGSYNGGGERFRGVIDEVKIYDRVYSADEIYVMEEV